MTLTRKEFADRVCAGEWPEAMAHGTSGNFYNYNLVRVRWPNGSVEDYDFGPGHSRYADDSALAEANKILGAKATGEA